MAARGRKSAAAQSVVSLASVQATHRPDPPTELTEEQAEEWVEVTSRMPADWFPRETHGLLAQYCRHIVAARRVAQLIAAQELAEEVDIETYDRLLKMQEREGRALSSLATRMRISQQALYDKTKSRGRGRGAAVKKPWES